MKRAFWLVITMLDCTKSYFEVIYLEMISEREDGSYDRLKQA
jgi:hypothetical protein